MNHGTISAYTNDSCRCSKCRKTWAARQRTYDRTARAAARYVRDNLPDVWAEIKAEQERRP